MHIRFRSSVTVLCVGGVLLSAIRALAFPSKDIYVCDDHFPVTAKCYLARGKKEEWDRRFAAALADFDKVIQLQPNWYEPYSHRAIIYDYQSHFDLAIADATRVIRLSPDPGMGYLLRAMAYGAKGLNGAAVSDATHAIDLGPAYRYISLAVRGAVLLNSGHPKRAIPDFSNAVALKDDEPTAYQGRATAYEKLGRRHDADANYATALSLLNSAIATTPNDGILYAQRGAVFEATSHEDQAIADETHALALDCPSPAYAYIYRGLAYDREGLHAKAATDLQSAVRIDRFSKMEWDRMNRLDTERAKRR